MKKFLIGTLVGVLVTVSTTVIASTMNFPDVKPSDWFYNDVMNMVQWGVIQGNADGTFKPQNNVNRAELSAMWNRYDTKVGSDLSLQVDELRYSLIQSMKQNALLFSNLASLYDIEMSDKPSCTMIEYYYGMMKSNYTAAENLSNIMHTAELKIDPTEFDKKLSDFRLVYNQCQFTE